MVRSTVAETRAWRNLLGSGVNTPTETFLPAADVTEHIQAYQNCMLSMAEDYQNF